MMSKNTLSDFSLWVDADSCPQVIRDIVAKCSKRLECHLFFVANRTLPIEESDFCHVIVTEKSPDAADNYILQKARQNDIVITKDLLFAQRLLQKNITVFNDRGFIFTKENIIPLIEEREYNLKMQKLGFGVTRKTGLSKQDVNLFANCLDVCTAKRMKQKKPF